MRSLGNLDPQFVPGTPEHATMLTTGRHPAVAAAMAWLCFSHLPEELQAFSAGFYNTGMWLLGQIGTDSAELITALNKLIEAKDSAVRAGIWHAHGKPGPVPRPQTVVDPPEFRGPIDNRIGPNFGRPIQDRPQA